MCEKLPRLFPFILLAVVNTSLVKADIIDFENRPDGQTSVDNQRLVNAYELAGGGNIRFFLDTNGNNQFDSDDVAPTFEQVGNDFSNGFVAEQAGENLFDTARPDATSSLGNFFLRQPNSIGGFSGSFMIQYDTPQSVSEFSGEIWDIDGLNGETEQWLVSALDSNGSVLREIYSPLGINQDPDSLDSLPWLFRFQNLPEDFQSVRISLVGTKTTDIGLAFDNFSPFVAVPEPNSILCLVLLSVGIVTVSRRRNTQPDLKT